MASGASIKTHMGPLFLGSLGLSIITPVLQMKKVISKLEVFKALRSRTLSCGDDETYPGYAEHRASNCFSYLAIIP